MWNTDIALFQGLKIFSQRTRKPTRRKTRKKKAIPLRKTVRNYHQKKEEARKMRRLKKGMALVLFVHRNRIRIRAATAAATETAADFHLHPISLVR
jgi:hypothetical protein